MDTIENPVLPEAIVPAPAVPLDEQGLLAVIGTGQTTGLPTASEQYEEMITIKRAQDTERAKAGSTIGGVESGAIQLGAQLPSNGATGVQI